MGGCHTSRLMFYLIFYFFGLFEIFPIIKLLVNAPLYIMLVNL